MSIENLDEDLVNFINKYFPNLDWDGEDTSASADLLLDDYRDVDHGLMMSIAEAMIATKNEEFTLTIRPQVTKDFRSNHKLIIYYID